MVNDGNELGHGGLELNSQGSLDLIFLLLIAVIYSEILL